jgi:thymidylate synthase
MVSTQMGFENILEGRLITLFQNTTADKVWQQAASIFREGELARSQASRAGNTDEIIHAAFSIEDPRQRWVTSRFPAINPAFALAEVVWIMLGRNDAHFIRYWNKQLNKFAGVGENYYGAYGKRLRAHFSLDQLDRAHKAFKLNPDTRQVVLQIWDVKSDFPFEDGQPRSEDIPCNLVSILKLRDNKLEWMQILRSNDFFLGIPHNFVQFTYLQEIMAGWLNVQLGSYNQISDSLHVYDDNKIKIDKSFPIMVEYNNDDIAVPRDVSEKCFSELGRRIDFFINERMTETEHSQVSSWPDAPIGFQNMLFVLASEAARKRGWSELATNIMSSNTNCALVQLWHRWLERIDCHNP